MGLGSIHGPHVHSFVVEHFQAYVNIVYVHLAPNLYQNINTLFIKIITQSDIILFTFSYNHLWLTFHLYK